MLRFSVTSFRAISPLYFLQDPAFGPQGVPALPELGGQRPPTPACGGRPCGPSPSAALFPHSGASNKSPAGTPLIPTGPSVYISVTVTASLGRAIKRARQVTVSTGL